MRLVRPALHLAAHLAAWCSTCLLAPWPYCSIRRHKSAEDLQQQADESLNGNLKYSTPSNNNAQLTLGQMH
ncbi:hypothetical protein EJ06DRAFT_528729 [Trichodelitschia bisporula]|uniref:Uncharacterized protein n=1 Tax=Trichodelitschia bisporula TaxID=703511 RepID=A0A6G1I2Z6_9PEZI|nr:hypothetical protein EJ06DRAFT_528729 [Trichodelitschia bisporula]